MDIHLLQVLCVLSLAIVACQATLPSELYWNSVLPNTPMPKAITSILRPDFTDEKSTSVVVGGNGVGVHTGKPGKHTDVGVGKGGVSVNTGGKGGGTHVEVGKKGGVGVSTGKPGRHTSVGVGKGGVSVSTGHKGKPIYVGVKPGSNPFVYLYAATQDQLQHDPNVALFFLEKDMRTGAKMNLHFFQSASAATFLPRQIAGAIPFSSAKLPAILNQFSVQPDSKEADMMKKTISECEATPVKDEEKYCATSLESMIDYSMSKLGKKVQAISTEVDKETNMQEYTISPGVKKIANNKAVVCHKQDYAYAVFYCHTSLTTRAYTVPLLGADGTKVKAAAICHTDTSAWNPKHLAFQVLKVKPGTVPICHFLPEDHIVWTGN
uniref:BURP domain-containing protein n=1 Tax=Kalanchoe fedtschenkoi TaxID=63787 RepID=A0A7N0ZV63_KALFE